MMFNSRLFEPLTQKYNVFVQAGDSVTREFMLPRYPLVFFLLTVFYLSFVLKLGPLFMQDQKPFKLQKILLAYNTIQILWNVGLFIETTKIVLSANKLCFDLEMTPSVHSLWKVTLFQSFSCLKLFDFLDTIFFVLLKKYSHITVLHVYHHTMMFTTFWTYLFCRQPGQVLYAIMANTLLHSVMYFYYFITALKPNYSASAWWKKYLTQLQMIQHAGIAIMFAISVLDPTCTSPKNWDTYGATQALIVLALFWNFYKKSYLKPKKS